MEKLVKPLRPWESVVLKLKRNFCKFTERGFKKLSKNFCVKMAHLLVILFLQGLFVNSKYIRLNFINVVFIGCWTDSINFSACRDYARLCPLGWKAAEIHFFKDY